MIPHRDALDKPPSDRFQVAADLCPEIKTLLERIVGIHRWNHDGSYAARCEYDNAAEDAKPLLARMAGEEPPR